MSTTVAAPPQPRAPRRPRGRRSAPLRRILLALLAVSLVPAGYAGYRLAQQFGYFLPSASLGTLPLVEVPARRAHGRLAARLP